MVCPRCHNNIPNNSSFCNVCGLPFQTQPVQYAQPAQAPAKKSSLKKITLITIFSVIGAIVVVILGVVIYKVIPRSVDYGDEVCFEEALNSGENVVGKVVTFKVREFATPVAGYNLHAGKHLNFVSFSNPGVSTGDKITVKVKRVQDMDEGKWSIWYTKVNGYETKNTKHKKE